MDNNDSKEQRVLKNFEVALDKHGYGFQYAVNAVKGKMYLNMNTISRIPSATAH